jgi:hypothetical protein
MGGRVGLQLLPQRRGSAIRHFMNQLEQRICDFARDSEVQIEALAMMKVGRDKADSTKVIMSRVIANLLFRFHGIPVKDIGGLN